MFERFKNLIARKPKPLVSAPSRASGGYSAGSSRRRDDSQSLIDPTNLGSPLNPFSPLYVGNASESPRPDTGACHPSNAASNAGDSYSSYSSCSGSASSSSSCDSGGGSCGGGGGD